MVEVKARFPLQAGAAQRLNLRFFLPTQLQIDERSLPRDRFLAGMLTHTRYQVRREGMALLASDHPENPLVRLADPETADAEYEIRMFCNLFHSALKDELRSPENHSAAVAQARIVLARFLEIADTSAVDADDRTRARQYLLSTTARRLAHHILSGSPGEDEMRAWLDELYRQGESYGIDPLEQSEAAVMRDSALKKWVQSVLYLDVQESRRNDRIFHVTAGIAAGIAMTVAVTATIFAESRWAGGSLPWAIALVGAYIVKDRIKEMLRGGLIRLLPGVVQDRVHLVFEGDGTKVVRKVALVRYPVDEHSRNSERWRSVDLQKRLTLKRRAIRRHRRVDAIVEIVRLETSDWTMRMDRAWKEWPVRQDDGTLALQRIPRLYEVFVQVNTGVGRGSRESALRRWNRRRRGIPKSRSQWYAITASRERISSVERLPGSPFGDGE